MPNYEQMYDEMIDEKGNIKPESAGQTSLSGKRTFGGLEAQQNLEGRYKDMLREESGRGKSHVNPEELTDDDRFLEQHAQSKPKQPQPQQKAQWKRLYVFVDWLNEDVKYVTLTPSAAKEYQKEHCQGYMGPRLVIKEVLVG